MNINEYKPFTVLCKTVGRAFGYGSRDRNSILDSGNSSVHALHVEHPRFSPTGRTGKDINLKLWRILPAAVGHTVLDGFTRLTQYLAAIYFATVLRKMWLCLLEVL